MKKIDDIKNYRITEYSILVCIFVLKIWCGFFNQALLFAVGGAISTLIDLALAVYIIINAKRSSVELDKRRITNNFVIVWLCFSVLYSLIFALGWDSLPQSSFLGMFDLPQQVYNMAFSIVYLIPLILVVKNASENERKLISGFLIAIFFAVAIANLITAIMNPDLVKNESYEEGTSLFTLGFGGSYALALMTPILLYKLQVSKHKFLFGIIFVANLLSVFYGGYFIAVLSAIVSLIIYFVLNMKNKAIAVILAILIISLLLAVLFTGWMEDFLRYLADVIPIDQFASRCEAIADYLAGDVDVAYGEDTTYRFVMYAETFENFLKHPLFGNFIFGNYACQRDHSTILDILAVGGLFLGALFSALLYFGYKFACSFIRDVRGRRVLLSTIITYLFISALNPVLSYSSLGIMFSVVPLLVGKKEVDVEE